MSVSLKGPAYLGNVTVYQGQEWLLRFAVEDDEEERQPLDGYRATSQIRVGQMTTSTLLLDLDEYLSIDLSVDEVVLEVPASATRTLNRSGWWDLFLVSEVDPDDAVPLFYARIKLQKAVTVDD